MKKVVVYVFLTAFLFGTMEVALKLTSSSIDAMQMTFLRFLIGGILLAPFAIGETKQKGTKFTGKDLGWLFLLGFMAIPVSMYAFQLGVERCNASTAASLFCMNPIFTMVIAHIFTEEKLTRTKLIAFGMCIVAAFFMIRPWDVQEGNTVLGIGLMLFAAVAFSAYTVMGRRTIGRFGTFTQTSISFLLGSIVLLPVLIATSRPVLEGVSSNLLGVAYCGIFVTGLGYLFYFLAIRYADASTGSIAFFIKPAIAPVLAVIILHESLYWNTILGIVILITASFMTLRDNGKQKKIGA